MDAALLEAHPEICSRGEASFGALLVGPLFEHLKSYNTRQRAGETNQFTGEDGIAIARHAIDILQRKWLDAMPESAAQRVRIISEKHPSTRLRSIRSLRSIRR